MGSQLGLLDWFGGASLLVFRKVCMDQLKLVSARLKLV
jgi:hypothetical protein